MFCSLATWNSKTYWLYTFTEDLEWKRAHHVEARFLRGQKLLVGAGGARLERLQHLVHTEAPGLLAGRVFLEALDKHADDRLGGDEQPELVGGPAAVHPGFEGKPLERVLTQVDHDWHVGLDHRAVGDVPLNDFEADLPVVDADRVEVGIVVEVEDLAARRLFHLALEERQEVVAVEVVLEGLAAGRVSLKELLLHIRNARGREERGHPILVGHDLVVDRAGLEHAGPTGEGGHAHTALPGRALLAVERGVAAVGPRHDLSAVIGREQDDRVVGDAEVVQLLQQPPDDVVELHHAVGVEAVAALVFPLRREARKHVHAGAVVPDEERLPGLDRPLHEVHRPRDQFVLDGFHALSRDGAGILAGLLADLAEPRVHRRVVHVRGLAVEQAARAEGRLELRVLRIIRVFGLLLGVEVVEVAVELIEATHRRQEFVAVAEMVLAELRRGVAQRLEQLGDRGVLVLNALLRAGHADLEQPGAEGSLAEDERGPPRRAGLLAIVVREDGTFLRDAIDVRRSSAHHAMIVRADVPDADVVAKDHKNVWQVLLLGRCIPRSENENSQQTMLRLGNSF